MSAPQATPQPDPEMMRRAAAACRNARKQMVGNTNWFDWVARWLDGEAKRIEQEDR